MKRIIILFLLLVGTTSVFASDFSWSRANHNRLNGFIRSTKLPPGQYLISVYSTGNTITEYVPEVIVVEKPTQPTSVPSTPEVIDEGGKEIPIISTLTGPVVHSPHRP